MADVGFPALVAVWEVNDIVWSSKITQAWHTFREPKLRGRWAQVAITNEIFGELSPGVLAAMMLDIAVVFKWFDLGLLARLSASDLAQPEVISLLDAAGNNAKYYDVMYYYERHSPDETASRLTFETLVAAYLKNSSLTGLLPILANLWPPGVDGSVISAVLPKFESSAPHIQKALLMLEIAGIHPGSRRLETLIQHASVCFSRTKTLPSTFSGRSDSI